MNAQKFLSNQIKDLHKNIDKKSDKLVKKLIDKKKSVEQMFKNNKEDKLELCEMDKNPYSHPNNLKYQEPQQKIFFSNQIKDLQMNIEIKSDKLLRELEDKRELVRQMFKKYEEDELEICEIDKYLYSHPDDPKYQELQQKKFDLRNKCIKAKITAKQIMREEREIIKQIRILDSEKSQLIQLD